MSALPPCLHVPVAARNEEAIQRFIGVIAGYEIPRAPQNALLVDIYDPPELDLSLPIWDLPESAILHSRRQLWVDVRYSGYRKAYAKAFPDADLATRVLDHVLNRRVARIKGFRYLRVVAISRAANSSSGGLSEKWAVEYQGSPEMIEWNKEHPMSIQYADLADIVKMLSIKTGNSLQDGVNESQKLVRAK